MTIPIRCRYSGHSRKGDADTLPTHIIRGFLFTKFVRFLKGIGKKVASNADAILMAESLGITILIREYRETLTFETPKDTVSVRSRN